MLFDREGEEGADACEDGEDGLDDTEGNEGAEGADDFEKIDGVDGFDGVEKIEGLEKIEGVEGRLTKDLNEGDSEGVDEVDGVDGIEGIDGINACDFCEEPPREILTDSSACVDFSGHWNFMPETAEEGELAGGASRPRDSFNMDCDEGFSMSGATEGTFRVESDGDFSGGETVDGLINAENDDGLIGIKAGEMFRVLSTPMFNGDGFDMFETIVAKFCLGIEAASDSEEGPVGKLFNKEKGELLGGLVMMEKGDTVCLGTVKGIDGMETFGKLIAAEKLAGLIIMEGGEMFCMLLDMMFAIFVVFKPLSPDKSKLSIGKNSPL